MIIFRMTQLIENVATLQECGSISQLSTILDFSGNVYMFFSGKKISPCIYTISGSVFLPYMRLIFIIEPSLNRTTLFGYLVSRSIQKLTVIFFILINSEFPFCDTWRILYLHGNRTFFFFNKMLFSCFLLQNCARGLTDVCKPSLIRRKSFSNGKASISFSEHPMLMTSSGTYYYL